MNQIAETKSVDLKQELSLVHVGDINFINYLPISLPLTFNFIDSKKQPKYKFEVLSDVPTKLNEKLRLGEIDLAPISSFEFLQNRYLYGVLGDICICSEAEVGSVLFVSDSPVSELKKIYLTSKSASSVALLKIILAKKYKLDLSEIEFVKVNFDEAMGEDFSNKLIIGDEALLEDTSKYKFVLDLGQEWKELTGSPMVFAVLAYNKKTLEDKDKLVYLSAFFNSLLDQGLGKLFPVVLKQASHQIGLGDDELRKYFDGLSYKLGDEELEGLRKFDDFAQELGLL